MAREFHIISTGPLLFSFLLSLPLSVPLSVIEYMCHELHISKKKKKPQQYTINDRNSKPKLIFSRIFWDISR